MTGTGPRIWSCVSCCIRRLSFRVSSLPAWGLRIGDAGTVGTHISTWFALIRAASWIYARNLRSVPSTTPLSEGLLA